MPDGDSDRFAPESGLTGEKPGLPRSDLLCLSFQPTRNPAKPDHADSEPAGIRLFSTRAASPARNLIAPGNTGGISTNLGR